MLEGGLRKPERKPLLLDDKDFWSEPSLDKELRRQFDVCHSCRRCFNLCDSFPKLFDLIDESESMELDTVESKSFNKVVDACTLCDMCFMVSCPYVPPHDFAIDIPSLFVRHKSIEDKKKLNFIDSQLAKTDRIGKIGLFFNTIINNILNKKNKILRKFFSYITGIDMTVTLPKYNKNSFKSIFKSIEATFKHKKNYRDKVLLFTSCYVNYNDSKIGEAIIGVLNKNKIYVEEFYSGCCKMPQLEQGKVFEVKKEAERTAKKVINKINQGYTVIAPIASCALMLKTHWPLLSPENEDVIKLSKNTMDIDEFIWDLNNKRGLADGMSALDKNITLHSSCHSRAQNIGPKSAQILKLIPNTNTVNVEKCSGHGGTWGIKKKNNKIARKVGLPAAKKIFKDENSIIASTCPLAALHLKDINDEKSLSNHQDKIFHPIELIAKAYGIKEIGNEKYSLSKIQN
jgi:glycerol-3-phosphate dehydrogenase subunit C